MQAIAFYLLAFATIAAGLLVVSAKNPVHSVLFLITAFFSAAGLFVLRPLSVQQCSDCDRELRQVGRNRVLHYPVRRVEVSMRELISHRRDFPPRDVGLLRRQRCIDVLDGFAYLDESNANGVEHQPVVERASFQVPVDSADGVEDVEQANRGRCGSQRHHVPVDVDAHARLDPIIGNDIDRNMQQRFHVGLEPREREQPRTVWQVYEQIEIGVGALLTARHTSKNANFGHRMLGRDR